MRRLFTFLFILSLGATVAALYWRNYLPEGTAPVAQSAPAAPTTRSAGPKETRRAPSAAPATQNTASDRQDWAVTISILSSIVSALAALVQTWLTARGIRR